MKRRYQSGVVNCKVAFLLFWSLFASYSLPVLKVEARALRSPSEKEIEAKLKLLNKPAEKTIKVFNFLLVYNYFENSGYFYYMIIKNYFI